MDRKPNYVYIVVILILIAIIFSILFKAHENYLIHKERMAYLNQPDSKIQDWMNIETVYNNFNLSSQDIFNEIGINEVKTNPHVSLNRLCREQHQNCTILIEKLNNRIGR